MSSNSCERKKKKPCELLFQTAGLSHPGPSPGLLPTAYHRVCSPHNGQKAPFKKIVQVASLPCSTPCSSGFRSPLLSSLTSSMTPRPLPTPLKYNGLLAVGLEFTSVDSHMSPSLPPCLCSITVLLRKPSPILEFKKRDPPHHSLSSLLCFIPYVALIIICFTMCLLYLFSH